MRLSSAPWADPPACHTLRLRCSLCACASLGACAMPRRHGKSASSWDTCAATGQPSRCEHGPQDCNWGTCNRGVEEEASARQLATTGLSSSLPARVDLLAVGICDRHDGRRRRVGHTLGFLSAPLGARIVAPLRAAFGVQVQQERGGKTGGAGHCAGRRGHAPGAPCTAGARGTGSAAGPLFAAQRGTGRSTAWLLGRALHTQVLLAQGEQSERQPNQY